jgi:hypothetical protein
MHGKRLTSGRRFSIKIDNYRQPSLRAVKRRSNPELYTALFSGLLRRFADRNDVVGLFLFSALGHPKNFSGLFGIAQFVVRPC